MHFAGAYIFLYFIYIFILYAPIIVDAYVLGLFRLEIISLLGIVFVYIIIINDSVLYIMIIINDLSYTF